MVRVKLLSPEFAQIILVISGIFLLLSPLLQRVISARAHDFEQVLTTTTILGYLSVVIGIVDLVAFVIVYVF